MSFVTSQRAHYIFMKSRARKTGKEWTFLIPRGFIDRLETQPAMSVPPPIGEGNIFQAVIVMVSDGRMSNNGSTVVSFFFSPLLITFSSL